MGSNRNEDVPRHTRSDSFQLDEEPRTSESLPLGGTASGVEKEDSTEKNYRQVLLADFAEECAMDRSLLPQLLEDLRIKGVIGKRDYLFREGH